MTDQFDITNPDALLDAAAIGAPRRREHEELEQLVADVLAADDTKGLREVRSLILGMRSFAVRDGRSVARLDELLRRVRERIRKL